VLIFSLALAAVEFLAILRYFTKQKLRNIFVNHTATCQQKLAADFPSLPLAATPIRINSLLTCVFTTLESYTNNLQLSPLTSVF
jgi:hypothetical protein